MGAATLIIQGLMVALSAAPQATALVKQVKDLFKTFRKENLITVAEEDKLNDFCDLAQKNALMGIELPSWEVEQDPTA